MIYRSFNEGLINGYQPPESYYKLCEDILSYTAKEVGNIQYNRKTIYSSSPDKYVKDSKLFQLAVSACEKDIKLYRRMKKQGFGFNFTLDANVSPKKLVSIASKLYTNFNFLNRPKSESEVKDFFQSDSLSYRKENDGSYTTLDTGVYTVYTNYVESGQQIKVALKNYKDGDRIKKKLNLKESTSCGIFSNIDFI